MAIRVAFLIFICFMCARAAAVNIQFVDENRKLDDLVTTVTFKMPSNVSTQHIRCPGSIFGLKPMGAMTEDVSIIDDKGRNGLLQASTGELAFSEQAVAQLRLDPRSESFQFYGSPGTWIQLQCLNVVEDIKVEDTYSKQYFHAYVDVDQNLTTCRQTRFQLNRAYFSCGYGYQPPYGCIHFDAERRSVCYQLKSPALDKWQLVSPDVAEFYETLEPFSNDERIKEFLEQLNNLAAQGDPYFEASTAREAERIADAARVETLLAQQAARAAEEDYRRLEAQNNQAVRAREPTYQHVPQSQPNTYSIAKIMWSVSIIISLGMIGNYALRA